MKPDIKFWSFDRGFKLGISWDVINGLGKTLVILFHLGPFVYSIGWRLETGGRGHCEPPKPWPRK